MEQDKSVTVRVTEDLKNYLKRWAAAASTVKKEAAAARIALETFRGITEVLGSQWWEIVRRADQNNRSAGQVIGAMIKAALEHEQKPKK